MKSASRQWGWTTADFLSSSRVYNLTSNWQIRKQGKHNSEEQNQTKHNSGAVWTTVTVTCTLRGLQQHLQHWWATVTSPWMSSATGNGPLEVNGIQNQCRETELQLDIGPVDSEDFAHITLCISISKKWDCWRNWQRSRKITNLNCLLIVWFDFNCFLQASNVQKRYDVKWVAHNFRVQIWIMFIDIWSIDVQCILLSLCCLIIGRSMLCTWLLAHE